MCSCFLWNPGSGTERVRVWYSPHTAYCTWLCDRWWSRWRFIDLSPADIGRADRGADCRSPRFARGVLLLAVPYIDLESGVGDSAGHCLPSRHRHRFVAQEAIVRPERHLFGPNGLTGVTGVPSRPRLPSSPVGFVVTSRPDKSSWLTAGRKGRQCRWPL